MADKQRPKQRGGPGKPFVKGDARINRAGRPPGRAKTLSEMLEAIPGGVSPLEFLLRTIADTKLPLVRRLEAAREALPFCHGRSREHVHDGLTLAERIESDGAPPFPPNSLYVPPVQVITEWPPSENRNGNAATTTRK
jgi:hypothetical protein